MFRTKKYQIIPNSSSKSKFLILSSTLLAIVLFGIWLTSNSASPFRADLKIFLSDELIRIAPPVLGVKADAIYVLGGSQRSLEHKYNAVADLFHKKICKKILLLSRPGKTEYSPSLGRNLTNDEWSLVKFNKLGIPREHIELTKIKEGFFGTFAEARGVSLLMKKRRYKSILLVSAPYHTHRVKVSFNHFLKKQNTTLFIQGSDEDVLLKNLIVEFIKLKVYKYILTQLFPQNSRIV